MLRKNLTNIRKILTRNQYSTNGKPTKRNMVNLEWVSNGNLGDELAPVIYDWMLQKRGINQNQKTDQTVHLMTVGSMIGSWYFDAVVWGSGAHQMDNFRRLLFLKHFQRLDIRAVRGPLTRQLLEYCGYQCPEVYGDPAVLMPLIYKPRPADKRYSVSVILHYRAENKEQWERENLHYLDIQTGDYEHFIDELLMSEKVISSSLHGIILAEAYGIPAVFLNTGGYVEKALMKYYDWYFSTGRRSVKMALTLEEALAMEPMELPELDGMRKGLTETFPYEIWIN